MSHLNNLVVCAQEKGLPLLYAGQSWSGHVEPFQQRWGGVPTTVVSHLVHKGNDLLEPNAVVIVDAWDLYTNIPEARAELAVIAADVEQVGGTIVVVMGEDCLCVANADGDGLLQEFSHPDAVGRMRALFPTFSGWLDARHGRKIKQAM